MGDSTKLLPQATASAGLTDGAGLGCGTHSMHQASLKYTPANAPLKMLTLTQNSTVTKKMETRRKRKNMRNQAVQCSQLLRPIMRMYSCRHNIHHDTMWQWTEATMLPINCNVPFPLFFIPAVPVVLHLLFRHLGSSTLRPGPNEVATSHGNEPNGRPLD